MKQKMLIIILFTCCICGCSNNVKENYQEKIKKLEQRVSDLETLNSNFININDNNENEENLKSVIEKMEDDINNLNTENSNLKSEINDLKNKLNDENNLFVVKFNSNGGYVAYRDSQTNITLVRKKESYSIIVSNGEKYGAGFYEFPIAYKDDSSIEFVGWYTKEDGQGEKINADTLVNLKSNIELYAYYKK